jgi:hypothetical protein
MTLRLRKQSDLTDTHSHTLGECRDVRADRLSRHWKRRGEQNASPASLIWIRFTSRNGVADVSAIPRWFLAGSLVRDCALNTASFSAWFMVHATGDRQFTVAPEHALAFRYNLGDAA